MSLIDIILLISISMVTTKLMDLICHIILYIQRKKINIFSLPKHCLLYKSQKSNL